MHNAYFPNNSEHNYLSMHNVCFVQLKKKSVGILHTCRQHILGMKGLHIHSHKVFLKAGRRAFALAVFGTIY